jgi:hypothetical protein
MHMNTWGPIPVLFTFESVAVGAFGASWLVKGEFVLKDQSGGHPIVRFGERCSGRSLSENGWDKPIVNEKENICGSRTCKPNSVRRIAPAGRSFLWAEHYCAAQATYPEVAARRAGTRLGRGLFSPPQTPSLFGLAPCGVCPARRITATAVRSYRTFSPLPWRCRRGGMFSVALSVNRD